MSDEPSALHQLADLCGILPGYVGTDGKHHETTDDARVAALRVMGIEAANPAAAARALAELKAADVAWPATRIAREGACVWLDLEGVPRSGTAVELSLENGETRRLPVSRRARRMRLPELPRGVHELTLCVGDDRVHQVLLVTPRRCPTFREKFGTRRLFGVWANLYSMRGTDGYGIGHLGDLEELVRFAGASGAAFVGINPLHCQRNRWHDISPYSGVSRIFRNPIYLDIDAIPEVAAGAARALEASQQDRLRQLRMAERLDYEAIAALQRPVLEAAHEAFQRQTGERARDYREFAERDDALAVDFGTFMALSEHMDQEGRGVDWRAWPSELRERDSEAVRAFRAEHEHEVDFHVFVQFELDRQLARVARAAGGSGLEIGIYQDLALGSAISGFDAWAFPDLVLEGANLGAPPDPYAEEGQDWGIPPLNPRAMVRDGYRFWRLMLRQAMVHSGALRIDHAMGLMRQFWVPAGAKATHGCYVRYPLHDLLAVVALEAARHDCLVIGEDLGTVPPGFSSLLSRAGVLSSRVMLFERSKTGAFRASSRYSRRALVTANTHDHPTMVGFAKARDVEIRREVGQMDRRGELAGKRARQRECRQLYRRLRREGVLGPDDPDPYPELCAAVYAFLSKCPAPLVGVSLDDLAGELEPVNVPGLPQEVYSSWTRRMGTRLEDLRTSEHVRVVLEALAARSADATGAAGAGS